MASDIQPSIVEKVGESRPQGEPIVESRAILALEGMTCASCAMRIEKGLKKVPGVKEASVNLATEQAAVVYNPTQADVQQMMRSVEAVGYKAILQVASAQETVPVGTAGNSAGTLATPASSLYQEDGQSKRTRA